MIRITIHPGYTFASDDPVTVAKLNMLLSMAYATLDAGTVGTTSLTDLAVTVDKLATALDLSGKTVTLPDMFNVATSIAAAPEKVGQLALVSGAWYIAQDTSAASDWVPWGAHALHFLKQAADIDGTADRMTFYTLENGGQLDLWFRRGTGSPVQLTGVSGTQLADVATPTWDSGWTLCNKQTTYDLTSTSSGAFSDTTKGSSTTGVTPASAQLTLTRYRVAKLFLKKAGSVAPYKDFLTFLGCIPDRYTGYSALLMNAGGDWGAEGFDNAVPDGNYDWTTGKLYLQTGANGIWKCYTNPSSALCDWDEKTNASLGGSANETLLRIQLWQ